MRAARFFVDAPLAANSSIDLPAGVAHHATRVLRLSDGDPIVLFNGQGGEWHARLSIAGKRALAAIETFDPIERESRLQITLVQSWIATDKLDWVIEKSVELGVHAIVLAPAQRSVVRLSGERLEKRLERLRELTIAACAQCGRNRVPHLMASATLDAALTTALDSDATGLLLEPAASNDQTPLIGAADQRIALAVGPEGGWQDDEQLLAQRLGYKAYRLGPRVLRTETAGLAALAALQAMAGDLFS